MWAINQHLDIAPSAFTSALSTEQRKQYFGAQTWVLELPSGRTFDEVLEHLIAIRQHFTNVPLHQSPTAFPGFNAPTLPQIEVAIGQYRRATRHKVEAFILPTMRMGQPDGCEGFS